MANQSTPIFRKVGERWQQEVRWGSKALAANNLPRYCDDNEFDTNQILSEQLQGDLHQRILSLQQIEIEKIATEVTRSIEEFERDVDGIACFKNHETDGATSDTRHTSDKKHLSGAEHSITLKALDVLPSISTKEYFRNSSKNSFHTSPQMEPQALNLDHTQDLDDLLQAPERHMKDETDSSREALLRTRRWQEIQTLREEIWGLRSQVHQLRVTLREKQENKAIADDLLIRHVSNMAVTKIQQDIPQNTLKTLDDLWKNCQTARDNYGPAEDDCNNLENILSQKEFRLARLERTFYLHTEQPEPLGPIVGPSSYQSSEPELASETSRLADLDDSRFHPLVVDYLSKLGDLDISQERLNELLDERHILEQKRLSRQTLGFDHNPEDRAWLDESQTEQADIEGNITSLEQEIKFLKQRCLILNLIDQDGDAIDPEDKEDLHLVETEGMHTQYARTE
ncbi:hypothetical protein VTL71DRAFT_3820 [Oculimacula yallundae]|uniref:Fibrous sheath-interacting protein 1 n=1 Tax=Oculimacula yallundae TaxID=86028 RepID=A0ABR4C5A7_9HELO